MSNEIQPIEGGVNTALYQIFTQETPRSEVRTRQGRGGRVLLYTDGAYVIRTLNQAFTWNWDFEADHEEILYYKDEPIEVRCRGRLTVRAGEITIVKTQFGSQPIEFLRDGSAPVSLGDAFKGAATDALKKCASLLGVALDLYDSDSEINTLPPALVQKEIQQAKEQTQITAKKDKAPRPLLPEQVKAFSTSRPGWKKAGQPSDDKLTYAVSSLSKACRGDDDYRHIVIEYLFGVQSMKDLTAGQCSFIIDWCGAKPENEYTINPATVEEIWSIVQTVVNLNRPVEATPDK